MKHFMAALLIILGSSKAFCWGALAHKATARIAWNFLDSDTQAKANALLNGDDFVESATWADSARGNAEWKFTIWFHFEKAPDDYTYLDNLKRQDDRTHKLGGLIEALYVAEDTLKNPAATTVDKQNALKFVIHFVGDIHQPLHTGRVEDNSGNKIPVKWLGFDTNLHSVWDSQMIYLGHKDVLADTTLSTDQSVLYANYLMTKFKDLKPTPDMFVRYDDWMHESMIPRKDAYAFKDESEQDYTNRFIETVDLRVYMAGLRIAYMVKRLVNQETPTDPINQLREAITTIVGNFSEFVSLKPRLIAVNPEPVTP
jgi:hypothetical protein